MAQCQACQGRGKRLFVPLPAAEPLYQMSFLPFSQPTLLPCPECGGAGIENCCEGLREQPDPGTA